MTIVAPPALRPTCSATTTSATVGVPSMMRARRNQVVNGSAADGSRRRVSEIEHDQPESARLQHEVHRLDRARDAGVSLVDADPPPDARAAHPEQAREVEPGVRGRRRIEPIAGVDERDELAAGRRFAQRPDHHAGTPRRTPADDLGEVAAAQAAAEPGVDRRHPGQRPRVRIFGQPGRRARERDVELARFQQRFEMGSCDHDRTTRSFSLFIRHSQGLA